MEISNEKTMQGVSELVPAFKDWAHLVMNDLAAAKNYIHLLEKAESSVQAETYKARAIRGLEDAMEKFRGVGV